MAEGLIPGMATGGLLGSTATLPGLRSWIAAAQYGERLKYSGLQQSFAAGPARYRTATVRSELGTLAKRQKDEEAAYKAVMSGSLTSAELTHLGAMARAESRTALDKALNQLPGGHPGFAKDLRKYLGQLSALSGKKVPPGSAGTGIPAPALWEKDPDLNGLLRSVDNEMHIFWKLMGSKLPKGATAAQHKALAAWDKALERQQVHTFGIGKGGLFQQLMDSFRNGRPPQWDAFGGAVDYMIREVGGTGSKGGINPPGTPRNSGWVPWHYFHKQWTDLLSALHLVRGRLTGAAPWKPGNLGASYTAPDGVLTFDSGRGILRPGFNLAWNGTGRDEALAPAGSSPVVLEFASGGGSEFEQFMVTMIRRFVRVRGGGDVQTAFGQG